MGRNLLKLSLSGILLFIVKYVPAIAEPNIEWQRMLKERRSRLWTSIPSEHWTIVKDVPNKPIPTNPYLVLDCNDGKHSESLLYARLPPLMHPMVVPAVIPTNNPSPIPVHIFSVKVFVEADSAL